MPRYTVEHTKNNITKYLHFSSIIDEPITNFMTKKEYKDWYIKEYSKEDYEDYLKGKRNKMDLERAVICCNLNKNECQHLNEKQFLEKYKFYQPKDKRETQTRKKIFEILKNKDYIIDLIEIEEKNAIKCNITNINMNYDDFRNIIYSFDNWSYTTPILSRSYFVIYQDCGYSEIS